MNDLQLTLDFPITRQHAGIPLANGSLGALVFGQDDTLAIAISLAQCWDHQFSERLVSPCPYRSLVEASDPLDVEPVARLLRQAGPDFPQHHGARIWLVGTRVPGGRFSLRLKAPLVSATLDYRTAVATIRTHAGALRLLLPIGHDAILVSDPERLVLDVRPDPMWNRLGDLWTQFGFQPPVSISRPDGGARGWFQPQPQDPGTLALARQRGDGWLITAQLADAPDAPQPDIPDWDRALADHRRWWDDFWSRQPTLQTPDAFVNRFFVHALYKFAAATTPHAIPAGLQGPWLEDYQRPPWSCDYHFNVNVQQIYSLAFPTGNLEHLQPLFDMLESRPFQDTLRQNARMMFGIDDGLLLTHAVDDRGQQVGGLGPGALLDFACGGWTALLYWWAYRHSADERFLADHAMPFMRGVMRVYEEALEEHDGRLSIPLAISAEYGFTFPIRVNGKEVRQSTGRDPSSQLACIHALANALIEGSRILGLEPKPIWLDIKRRLPHMTTIGEGSARHLAIWEGQDLDVCHRHHSHLSLITPFDITAELSPDEQTWLTEAIDHWILRGMGQWSEWCYPWAIQLHARRGFTESPALLLNLWRAIFVNEGLTTVYLPRLQGITAHRRADMLKPKETSEVMQLDGTMAGATAMLDLLVHELGGVIRLFHGVPHDWQDAEFAEVRLPRQCRISARRQHGRTVACTVTAGDVPADLTLVPEPNADPIAIRLQPHQTWSLN